MASAAFGADASQQLIAQTMAIHSSGSQSTRALHVLNRLGLGPSPWDLQRLESMGLDRYIQQQL
ncbi:DUF1800 domain-containing protein, partial [Lyngbya confervoides]